MHGVPEGSSPARGSGSPPDVELAAPSQASAADLVVHWLDTADPADGGAALGPDPEADPTSVPAPGAAAGLGRVKAKAAASKKQSAVVAQRKWLMMDSEGETRMVSLNKHDLTRVLGIQLRDLRLLDPQLASSYPSAILCRERALVVNLEFVKMIVGLDCCYVTHLEDENTAAFVAELQRRLAAAARGLPSTKSTMDLAAAEGAAAVGGAGAPGLDQLPFELRVLECALDVVSGYLERLTSDLEAAAHPALDALTVKVTTGNLERVRRVKNRLVRLTTRVETLREVLEKFLDDDGDMRDMNLAARAAREAADAARAGAAFDAAAGARAGGAKTPGTPRSLALTYDSEEEEREAVDAVEQLLESYFMQVDNAWNKLQTLTEYVDDTEDYVNIELDSHRNKLIQLNLVLTCFSASVGLITAITGLFAMNTQLYPGNVDKAPFSLFLVIALTSSSLALLLFVGVLGYCRWKKII